MAPEQRRLMNHAVYEKLYVFEDTVTDATFNPPFNDLLALRDSWRQPPVGDGDDGAHSDPQPDTPFVGVQVSGSWWR
jgi:hypothetical protein